MTDYIILGAIGCVNISIVIWLIRLYKQQQKHFDILLNALCIQLKMQSYMEEVAVSNLWKIRQEIYSWMQHWAAQDEFDAAQQAKNMIENIERLIEIHTKRVQENENNQRKNGFGI